MNPLQSIGRIGSIDAASLASGAAPAGGVSFGKTLEDALAKVSGDQSRAQSMAHDFQAENPNVSLEDTMIAMQQSSLSFQAVVQVRNKLVTAYNEMMNMQV